MESVFYEAMEVVTRRFVQFTGTRVTPEAFLAWKKKFDAEIRAVEEKEKWVKISSFFNSES